MKGGQNKMTDKYTKMRRLMRAERRIENESDREMQEYWEEQGLDRKFPHRFSPDSFFYSHVATTEQQATIDECFNRDCPSEGYDVGWICKIDFINDPDKYLGN